MDNDRRTNTLWTISRSTRDADLYWPAVKKLGMPGDEVAVGYDANLRRILIDPGNALPSGSGADREEQKLVVFKIFFLPEEERQAQPRPQGREDAQRLDAKVAVLDRKRGAPVRGDDIVQTRRKRHEDALVAGADPELGK